MPWSQDMGGLCSPASPRAPHVPEPSPSVKRGGQTDTCAPPPASMEKEPCCPQHRQPLELSWPQDPPANSRQEGGAAQCPNRLWAHPSPSQAGFRQAPGQHLRPSPGNQQQHYWSRAGHVSGEEESSTSLTTEPQERHTQAKGSGTRW